MVTLGFTGSGAGSFFAKADKTDSSWNLHERECTTVNGRQRQGFPADSNYKDYASPNNFRMFCIAWVKGLSGAGPLPQISIGGLVPNTAS